MLMGVRTTAAACLVGGRRRLGYGAYANAADGGDTRAQPPSASPSVKHAGAAPLALRPVAAGQPVWRPTRAVLGSVS